MNYALFDQIVFEHQKSLVIMFVVTLIFAVAGLLVVEFYVRGKLNCRFFEIGKFKFSPTWLMIIPIAAIFIVYPVQICRCDNDIKNNAYVEYVGKVEYSSSSVKFIDGGFYVFVGKGHKIVPDGLSYGKVIYAKQSKVIVYYEKMNDE